MASGSLEIVDRFDAAGTWEFGAAKMYLVFCLCFGSFFGLPYRTLNMKLHGETKEMKR